MHNNFAEPTQDDLLSVLYDYYTTALSGQEVVVLDATMEALSTVVWNDSLANSEHMQIKGQLARRSASQSTQFSCRIGHDETSPVCALCSAEFAGGSTALCNSCGVGDNAGTMARVLAGAFTSYIVLVFLPAQITASA